MHSELFAAGELSPMVHEERAPSAATYQSAVVHMQAGRDLEAQSACARVLEADSHHADAMHLMGALCVRLRQDDLAIEWIARAIRQDPKPHYVANLGSVLQSQGRFDEALHAFDKAVQLDPNVSLSWKKLAGVLTEMKRPAEAALGFQRALALDPQDWDAATRAGLQLLAADKPQEALACLDLAERLAPNRDVVLETRASAFYALQRYEECLQDNLRAHQLNPANATICNNAGNVLQVLGRYEEALAWFEQALELQPRHLFALINKASALQRLHRFDEAAAIYAYVRAVDQGHSGAEAEWGLSHLNLLLGDFAQGWRQREARWSKVERTVYPKFPQPMWLGDGDISGKTLLVCAEEGLGDTIQFARYIPMLAERGARVILVVAAPLCPLLSRLPGVAQCLPTSVQSLPQFDLHCPIGSLPLAFRTGLDSIPAPSAYLPPLPEEQRLVWESRLGPRTRLRVGLVWSGNPNNPNDRQRSMPFKMMSALLDVDVTFVSLQKDPKTEDKALLGQTGILDLTSLLTDFSETAALASCLDLIITVDTSIAHLAGALGRPTWILLPHTPDYRWLLDRDDSPWYPTVRLFRQTGARDYGVVLERVRSELARLADRPPGNSAAC